MNLTNGIADLHMHTTASDGTDTVSNRIQQAVKRGLDAIAITDHDNIADSLTTRCTRQQGLEVVTGVEVRADVRDTKVEILGYFVDPMDDNLQQLLTQVRDFRSRRNRAMVARVSEQTGLELDYEMLAESVDGMLGRPHIARRLLDAEVVDSIGEAFDEYLATGGDAYVAMELVSATEVIDSIRRAGGVASMAHPGRVRTTDVAPLVGDLVNEGLDALEVWYPYAEAASEGYADVSVADAALLAEEHGLLKTGGSDCHGSNSGNFRIGDVRVPEQEFEALRRRAQ